jgi:hypothetical protein
MRTIAAAAVALLALLGAGAAEATDRRDHHRWDGGRHDDWRHRGWERHDWRDHRRDRWDHRRHGDHRWHGWNDRHGGRVIVVPPPRTIYVYPQPFSYW